MPIIVALPDGSEAEFPDGTPPDIIKSSLAKKFGNAPAPNPAQPEPAVLPDVAKSAGIGVVKGVLGMGSLPGNIEMLGRMGIDKGAELLGVPNPETQKGQILPTYSDYKRSLETVTGPLYEPKTTAGKYAESIAAFAPAVAGGPGGLVAKGLTAVGAGGASEAAGQMTAGTVAEIPARVVGALVGGRLPNAISRGYVPVNTSPERQRAVQTLRNEGVTDLTAGEVTGSKPLRWLEQSANDIPFSGGRVLSRNERAAEQFTAAALRRAGIQNEARATTDVIDGAFTRIGQQFDNLIQQTGSIPIRSQVLRRATQAADDYAAISSPANRIPLVENIRRELTAMATPGSASPGVMPARQYNVWRSQIGAAARGTQDATTKQALYNLQAALDDAVGSSFNNQALRDSWRQTRREYRNLLTIEKAALGGGEAAASGIISPAKLRQAAQSIDKRNFKRGRSDFSDLATAGQQIMSPMPNSGTPARLAAQQIMSLPTQLVAGGLTGGPVAAIGAPVTSALASRAFLSAPVQNWMGASGIQRQQVPVSGPRNAMMAAAMGLPESIDPDVLSRLAFAPNMPR